jgi:hypothetical protein
MKQYIARYLPTEGELKEEDKIFPNQQHKVKLFLTTNDIQIDNEVYDCFNNKIGLCAELKPQPDGKIAVIFANKTYLFKEECYKIVGEISDKAIWVKDGDVFNETEVYHCHYYFEDGKRFATGSYSKDAISLFEIKCSQCGSFH